MKALAKELGCGVLLLSQLNRGGANEGSEPSLTSLKESGSIEEDADVVVLLHPWGRDDCGATIVLAKIAKNRGGRRGRFAMRFDGAVQTWAPSTVDVSPRRGAA